MADTKISALPASTTPLAGTEVLPVVQSGVTKQVTVANLTAGRAVSAASYSSTGNAYFGGAVALAGATEVGLGTNSATNAFFNINSAGNSQFRIYIGGAYQGGMYSTGSGSMVASNGQLNFSVDSGGNSFGYFGAELGGVSNFHVVNGSVVIGTAGKGIDFSANTHAAGMTSELLNWYEEGTWTPVVTSGTGTITSYTAAGRYTRIGRQVTLTWYISVSNNGTGAGYINITGAPFSSGVGNTALFGFNQSSGAACTGAINSTTLEMYKYDATYPIATGQTINGSITYSV